MEITTEVRFYCYSTFNSKFKVGFKKTDELILKATCLFKVILKFL